MRTASFTSLLMVTLALAQSPPYANRALFTEQEVIVGSDPWALPGTLSLPKSTGPNPVVVFVHGSGPSDRDATISGPSSSLGTVWGVC